MSPIRPEAITKLDKSLGVLESFGFVFEGLITNVESARYDFRLMYCGLKLDFFMLIQIMTQNQV